MDISFSFKALVDQLSDEVFILRVTETGSFEMAYYNTAFNDKYNTDKRTLIGEPLEQCISADCLAKMRITLNTVIATRIKTSYEETMQLYGEEVMLYITIIPFDNTGGSIEYIACCSKDITSLKNHQKHSEENKTALKEVANVYQSIIDSTNNNILVMDKNFQIKVANKTARNYSIKVWGHDNLIGTNALDYLSGEARSIAEKHLQSVINDQQPITYEHTVKALAGNEIWMLRRYYPIYDTQQILTGVLMASNDITEIKTRELYIRKQNSRLRDIANMQSHMLRRPVANILGLIDLLNLSGYNDEEFDQCILLLKESAEQLDSVMKNIVDTSKID